MKIDSPSPSAPQPDRTPRRLTPRASGRAPSADTGANSDAIEISAEGRRVVEFPKDARERADLVNRLRSEVDAGTYRPDAEAVARRLAERLER